jgi:predicted ABC-type transport system involved in lysophospholipase L1 biosynthesis ATPase subunit
MLLGLAEPTSGTMRLLGHDLPGGRAAALARVGAIVEEPRFHGHLTGRENLHVHAAARDRAAHGRVDGALARVGLGRRGDDRVKTYSLGRLAQIGALGDVRYAIPSATARIGGDLAGEVALAVAILVVAGWMAVTLGAGLWRTRTQEI